MKLTAALFALGLATVTVLATSPAVQAQTLTPTMTTPTTTTNRATLDDPAVNMRETQNYNALVGSDSSFRARRMQTECGPIEAADLRQQCMESFGAASSGAGGARPLTPARGTR